MRILVWNIQFFTLKRIQNATGDSFFFQVLNQAIAQANRDHIVSTVTLADPDVVVIVEPRCEQPANVAEVGELASGSGPDGLIYLYQLLHAINPNWYLVPPLKTVSKDILSQATYTEAVGFFYRGDRFDFTGPWVWPANHVATGPSVVPGVNVVAANYPVLWANLLPANTQFASQARFYDANQQEVLFTTANDRRPVLTTFCQHGVLNPITYKVFACHTTPTKYPKAASCRALGLAEALPGDREVSAVVGDFNVDIRDGKNAAFINEADLLYDFDGVFRSTDGPTTTKMVSQAEPSGYLKSASYDNIFVRYGTNTVVPAHNKAVVNRVAGSLRFPADMANALANYPLHSGALLLQRFRTYYNYGHIGNFPGTSDHLAIVADI
ncbi:MAG: hypothetical protein HYR56_34120 [Acidobacteria bacterium]|nr:hypothetical protein [Acidobacteriota bacterium]MBI3422133.1 hypothetical protein [Acidobacteriota bacterium]